MAYYARPDEDTAQTAAGITASAEDPAYPAENLLASNPAKPAKLTTPSGWWVLEFSGKKAPKALALLYQYLDEGLSVFIQANDTDVWTSPAFSQAVTIPPKRRDGPSYQRWTHNAFALLEELDDPDGYFFWRLLISGTNSQNVCIGRLWLLEDIHQVDVFHANGDIGEGDETPGSIIDYTERRVRLPTVIGGPQRTLSGALICTDLSAGSAPAQAAAEFRALYESTDGTAELILLIPQLADDEPWIVYFEQPPTRLHAQGGYQVWAFTLREASRGEPWP